LDKRYEIKCCSFENMFEQLDIKIGTQWELVRKLVGTTKLNQHFFPSSHSLPKKKLGLVSACCFTSPPKFVATIFGLVVVLRTGRIFIAPS
jgi:hypothetical protein